MLSTYAKSKLNIFLYKNFILSNNSKATRKKNNKSNSKGSSENSDQKNDINNNLVIYSKTKEINKDLNNLSNIILLNNKTNNFFKKDKDVFRLGNKSNSLTPFNPNSEKNPKIIQDELKKITNFKKVLTRNSKFFSQKSGKDIIGKANGDKNKRSSNKLVIKKKVVKKKSRFSNNVPNNNNINNKNSNKNNNMNKYSQKNINVNIINSFRIINKEKMQRRNSCGKLFYKPKSMTKFSHRSYNNLNFSILENSLSKKNEKNKKINTITSKSVMKYNFESFKISKNISVNYKNINNANKEKIKYVEEKKVVFYSILVKNLLFNYFKNNIVDQEKFESEKRQFLYQLFYCLELSKIYIFNFKQNQLSPGQSPIPLLKQSSSRGSKDIPTFKHFYEIFSDFSQIKISSQEKYEAYPNIEHVNQYFIFKDKQIGKGGSSVVYLGEDEKQKKFAIKVTSKNLKANPSKKIYDYVKEEVSILKRIHSKYIVTTYEVIESRNKIYIIMEYMSAGSVLNILELMDENKIKQYTRDLICAVEHCHEIANVIHKDINVNNILINQDGEAKLCDFGISEPFEDNNDLLLSKGPSTYTPPEKKCQEKYKGKPADIYLIGLTLFHMVFKRPLFTDFGNLTTNDYKNITIPKKDNKNREINKNLYDLIESLLKFNPEERPTLSKLKKDPWLTDNMKNPFPDIMKEALFYSLELTKKQIKEMNEDNNEKNNDSLNIDDEDIKDKKESEEEEESSEEESSFSEDS